MWGGEMIKEIHDYVKQGYEQGAYAETRQPDIKASIIDVNDDYTMGYQKAKADYINQYKFHYFPLAILKVINTIFHNRMIEVVNYVQGYNDGKVAALRDARE